MKRGTRMQPVDSAGLPNRPTGAHLRLRVCPVCSETLPDGVKSGTGWKWLAHHLAGHLGYGWQDNGWSELQATNLTDTASSTTTRSD